MKPTITDIHQTAASLTDEMIAAGLAKPEAAIEIGSHGAQVAVALRYDANGCGVATLQKYFIAPSLSGAAAGAREWIAGQPKAVQRARLDAVTRLGQSIDALRAAGAADELVGALEAAMSTLARAGSHDQGEG